MQTAFVPYRPLNASYTPQRHAVVNTLQPYQGDDLLYNCFLALAEEAKRYDFSVTMPPKPPPFRLVAVGIANRCPHRPSDQACQEYLSR